MFQHYCDNLYLFENASPSDVRTFFVTAQDDLSPFEYGQLVARFIQISSVAANSYIAAFS